MKVVIVESPTKARTIQGFLGKSYKVISSMGHIIDLPPKSFGVDVEKDFAPEYVILKKKIAQELKSTGNKAELVILAMDPDREGEAIAYHIQSLMKKPAKRALFYEITKRAVENSIKNLSDIDLAKVEAQQARRILDRLVGYEISPLLWRVFNNKELSAGRVQSVALRIICEREKEIRDFKPEEFWDMKCKCRGNSRTALTFLAKLIKLKIPSKKEADKVEKELNLAKFIVKDFKKKEKQRTPYPPYITSSMQQDASARLRFSTKQTMMIAQQLFEGIELPKGRTGLITYMRTDSLRVAGHAINEARKYIGDKLGKEYLPDKPRGYGKTKGAHEAIRPTSVNHTPESVKKFLTPQQLRLYSLIWQRFLASQITNARYEMRTMNIEAGKYELRAESEALKFSGFTKIYSVGQKKEELIPEFKQGDKLTLLEVMKEQKFTQPKPRYTEGTMVRELESKGIGRPSTYAPIISRIIGKDYVRKTERKLVPTDLGESVNKVLVSHFQDIFDVGFTQQMEENLDKVESKEADRVSILKEFYKPFKKDVTKFAEARKEVKKEITELTDEKCELCGKPMAIKWGRYGKFLGCSGFPECKSVKPLKSCETDEICPKCGASLLRKEGKYGAFLACPNYPKCKFTKSITIGIKCPECKGEIIERRTKKGRIFYGCSNYPKCKFALWDKPVAQKCPECGYSIMIEKNGKLSCPKCKSRAKGEK
ncbi:type I DNA topoisomerase [candidate division WOR-3 bacterium]|nr:type I DNA topoisomerase [candidate division WOR-3 bacterium]